MSDALRTTHTINIAGFNKAEVLAVLYNASKPQGMGFMHYDPKPMTKEEAEALLKKTTYFDYLKGRVMKVVLSGDELNPWGYDRDNGQGAMERALADLLRTGSANPATIQATHHINTLGSAKATKASLDKESRLESHDGFTVLRLGLAEVADKLGPAIDEAVRKAQTKAEGK